jgi:hypothetical protein
MDAFYMHHNASSHAPRKKQASLKIEEINSQSEHT